MTERFLGNLFIVAAPSGGGKTSLVKQLIQRLEGIEVSISHTTRKPRPKEVDGVDYFFVSDMDFVEMINRNAFIEHAKVFGHYYGTSAEQISARLKAGIDVVLDIDWQGAQQIRQVFPRAVSVFIIPPSLQTLKERLLQRGQDKEAIIEDRMLRAQEEMSHYAEFDYLIVNEDFETAANNLCAIVTANRLSITRQKIKLAKSLSFLLASK
jgi:guanylate kinase